MRRGILAAVGAFIVLGVITASITVKGVLVPTMDEFNALEARVDALEAVVFPSPTPPPTTTTEPPPTTTTAPPSSCTGLTVAPGPGLKAAMDGAPAGTTFCLQPGTYTVAATINTQDGDKVLGAGRDATFIDGAGLPPSSGIIFRLTGQNTFADFDISGAPTPPVGGTPCVNQQGVTDATWCGQAFRDYGASHTFTNIDCHDNGGNCIGGAASLTISGLDCWNNGNAYSSTSSFKYAACIKQAAAYNLGNNNVTITGSSIHDNIWDGLWCDFCKYGDWDIHGNTISNNGGEGIQWEMSGGWTAYDSAHVYDNVFHGNNYASGQSFRGGVHVSTANDIVIENNTFGQNTGSAVGIIYTASRNPPQPDSRGVIVQTNTLNGDVLTGCGLAGVVCSGNA
jgi:hypothetical protein